MSDQALSQPILVTGGNGFIASRIIKLLLEQGATVRATVRNKSNTEKYAHLTAIAENAPGTLEMFEADLLEEGSFDAAANGCGIVMHTASPFVIQGVKDPEAELVRPALQGTRNVLRAVDRADSVHRVVLTSSVVSIFGDAIEIEDAPNKTFTEAQWNTSSSLSHQPYPYSKVLAEKEAWKIADAQRRWKLVVINPGFVLGPSLTQDSSSGSITLMKQIMDGSFSSGVPDLNFGVVDVRDVAQAHLEAAFRPDAEGRHILSNAKSVSMYEIGEILKGKYGDKYKFPARVLPKFMLYLVGPFIGFSWKYIGNNVGIPIAFDNSKSREKLGIKYRAPKESILAHAEEMIKAGVV